MQESIRLDIYIHQDLSNQSTALERIEDKLDLVLKKEKQLMVDFTALTAQVQAETDEVTAIQAVVTALVKAITDAVSTADAATQAKVDAVTKAFTANNVALATAVASGTAAIPPVPTPIVPLVATV